MGKIKSKNPKPQVGIDKSLNKQCAETLSFSFRYLTTNKNFNFGKLDKANKKEWLSALTERIIEISQKSWIHWQGLSKGQGMETLYAKQLNFSPNEYELSEDEKVIIFRFNSQKGRIIGVKGNGCSVLYIIGLDVDYSAYKH